MEILPLFNAWWSEGKVSPQLAPEYKREAFARALKLLDTRQVTVLSGLRRVGKSTIMYQLIQHLLARGTEASRILYFSFDEKVEHPRDVLEKYGELTKVDWKHEKCYVFFDEVQKLPNWGDKIKMLYDVFPNLKIVVSGSSSFHLEKEAVVNLAGRHFVTTVEPLSFKEFLELRGSKADLSRPALWEMELKREFQDYLHRPFPEIVNWQDMVLIKSYIKDNVLEKVLRIDLSQRFKRLNEDLLFRLVDIIYRQPGIYLNYDGLSKELKISKKTIFQHLFYLELAYVIRKVKNRRSHVMTTSRKLQRAYPFHWSLEFGWRGDINMETIVASLVDAQFYWRKGSREVDFLADNGDAAPTPIEVKQSETIYSSDLKSLTLAMDLFKSETGIVVNNGPEEKVQLGKFTIQKVPLWKFALTRPHHAKP